MRKRLVLGEGVIGGVCEGLGNYFNIDPVFVRIIFVIALLCYGVGLVPYIVLWVAMPEE